MADSSPLNILRPGEVPDPPVMPGPSGPPDTKGAAWLDPSSTRAERMADLEAFVTEVQATNPAAFDGTGREGSD